MFKFATRKIAFQSTPYSSHVLLASSFPCKQQIRFYKPRLEESTTKSSPTVVPDSGIDDLFFNEEASTAVEVVDPWAVGPWNGGQPSLQYHIPPGADEMVVFQQMKKDLNEGTINDTSENRYHYKRSRRLFQRRLQVRKMGWVENNSYLTRTAKEEKDARDSAKDVKARSGPDFVVRPLFEYKGKSYSMESGTNTTKSSQPGADRSILLDLEQDEDDVDAKKKKKKKDKF